MAFRRCPSRAPGAAVPALVAALVLAAPAGARAETPAFGPSVVLRCKTALSRNCSQNVEPDVKIDPAGNGYVSAIVGVPAGTNFWRRQAGQTTYSHRGQPEEITVGPRKVVTPGGGDTALAVATVPNAQGFYNVYIATLWAGGVTVMTSRDGGATWEYNPLAAPITADRQWIVADGAETVWHAYVDFQRGAAAVVARSDDGGRTFGVPIPVYEPEDQARGALFRSRWSPLAIDRSGGTSRGALYWVFTNVDDLGEAAMGSLPQNPLGVKRHVLRIAISRDGGTTWHNRLVWKADPSTRVDAVFPWVAVDDAGTVYVVWSTTAGVFLSASQDGGETWSAAPTPVSSAPATTVVFPAVVAGRAGTVDIAYLGAATATPDDTTALWDVYFAQSLDGGASFTQVVASDQPVHRGDVCLRGLGCTTASVTGEPSDRSLAEVVTIALDVDGMAVIAAPYDYRKGAVQGAGQSLLIKQTGGARGFDSDLPVIPLTEEPR